MDKLQELAAITALNKMLRDEYFSICTIDTIMKMANVVPDRRAYQILHTLHCVRYRDMPTELIKELPKLIQECLHMETIFQFEELKQKTITVSPVKRIVNYLSQR